MKHTLSCTNVFLIVCVGACVHVLVYEYKCTMYVITCMYHSSMLSHHCLISVPHIIITYTI